VNKDARRAGGSNYDGEECIPAIVALTWNAGAWWICYLPAVRRLMPESAPDFAALLARARSGDQAALARLTTQYEPKLRLAARVLLGPSLRPYLDSVDLVQSVHKSLLLGLRDQKYALNGPENLLALALTLVRRKVARHWRRLKRQQRQSGETAGGDLAETLVAWSRPEDDPARAVQFRDQVAHLCQNLSAAERRLLELRSLGYTPAECAAELELSAVAFRVRLTRLRQRLRAAGVLDDWL
jgi:RNA polymerase sigma-70 factor (ECF subfamily)